MRDGGSAVAWVPAARQSHLELPFQELRSTTAGPRDASAAAVERSLVTLILHEVGRAAGPSDRALQSPGVVTASLRYIERNCLRKLTLQEVAEAVGRTPSYVTTALRQATGRSAVAWVTAHRLAEAQRLLRHSDERVDVVAERVGYADATHFIRTFRRAFGLTPAAWRVAR